MACVIIRVNGRVMVEVPDGMKPQDAVSLANEHVSNANFGPNGDAYVSALEDIDWEPIYMEAENGFRTELC